MDTTFTPFEKWVMYSTNNKKSNIKYDYDSCCGCLTTPIIGNQFKCKDCFDFIFCVKCIGVKQHHNLHTFRMLK
jgi:hypothetical protein